MVISERFIAIALGTGAISLLTGLLYQAVGQILDQRKYPPQGELIDIGEFRLHINCIGQGTPSLGDLPLIVVSQGAKDPRISDARFQQWESLQVDLTKLSSNSQRIIAKNSGHNIPLDQPELIVSNVQQLIEIV